jgi:hypothetical protein
MSPASQFHVFHSLRGFTWDNKPSPAHFSVPLSTVWAGGLNTTFVCSVPLSQPDEANPVVLGVHD